MCCNGLEQVLSPNKHSELKRGGEWEARPANQEEVGGKKCEIRMHTKTQTNRHTDT